MSLAIVHTRAQLGVVAPAVTVETHMSPGLPALNLVGLPEAAVRESRERVRSAILNAGYEFPQRRITINLAPADLPKDGGRFDLAIAVGILAASGQIPTDNLHKVELLGELALSGDLRAVTGVLPAAVACKKAGRALLIPNENRQEARLVRELKVRVADHLLDVCAAFSGQKKLEAVEPQVEMPLHSIQRHDLSDVKGQVQAKRALEIAAAGGHNLLMSGVPGSGKSMLAARLPSLLPTLNEDERLEAAAIYSVAGLPVDNICQGVRPFRAPHHTASPAALVGGGSHPRPGEISLAHQGVLFLDEMPEFSRKVLEVMREPLETGQILISRASRQTEFPARFQLIGAMNPCPCGYAGDPSGRCRCTPDQVRRYQDKLSGPLLDRIDLFVNVAALPADTLLRLDGQPSESSAQVAERVSQALARQYERQGCRNNVLEAKQLDAICDLSDSSRDTLAGAASRFGLSARACHRVLKVARTIADLKGDVAVGRPAIMEALGFREGLSNGR
ncbi:YifB family Mg chelatase-like AAA ATPase [Neptunomonas phycophila]|uniref:YifB family Mg chelatase-like AAA ATPase n=1 Tax=Neptunomonas phycophila TaxID=1572645 RepID=A0AAW7XL08_9GAMM|nr:YifB family Mg chelatase-like AAA ATPase [Neptunomonas phycophila]MDO6453623.1 YifB family Mg chelatase-like AAA ATPase [Neptunomonas phycophila]